HGRRYRSSRRRFTHVHVNHDSEIVIDTDDTIDEADDGEQVELRVDSCLEHVELAEEASRGRRSRKREQEKRKRQRRGGMTPTDASEIFVTGGFGSVAPTQDQGPERTDGRDRIG